MISPDFYKTGSSTRNGLHSSPLLPIVISWRLFTILFSPMRSSFLREGRFYRLPSRHYHGSFHGVSSGLQDCLVPFRGSITRGYGLSVRGRCAHECRSSKGLGQPFARAGCGEHAGRHTSSPKPFLALSPRVTILRRHEYCCLSICLISHHDFPPSGTLVMYWLYFSTIVEHTIHNHNIENRWQTPLSPKVTSTTTTGVYHCHHEAGTNRTVFRRSSRRVGPS